MIYAELYLTNQATGSKSLLTTASGLTFDVQADFRPSTLSFVVTKDEGVAKDIRSGKFFCIVIDSVELPTYYVLEGDGLDFVTEDGVVATKFSGRSLHCIGEDDCVFPSAWPNPTPSGHAFQNATPGTIIQTLVQRAQQDRSTLTAWTTTTFTGTHDSNGVTWPAMVDRNFSNGDSILQVIQGLVDDGVMEADVVGFDLRLYVPGTLGVVRTQDKVTFRPGYSLTAGETQRDATEMATDVFGIGDGSAVAHKTRPALYDVVGRRRVKFVQYGGIADSNIIGILADAQLDTSGHVKQEDTVSVPHTVYQPFTDYKLYDWVSLDRGAGTVESVQIKQISVNQSEEDYDVSVSLGDLLDSLDQKLARRIDAITGANAGGGAIPSDKSDDKLAPAAPSAVSISSLGYIDQNGNRKVAALVDWPDVATNSNGTPADDIDHYEYQYRTSNSAPSGTPTALTPGRPNVNLNTLFDRRSKPFGWVGGDGVANTRNSSTGKDYWAFGDSGIGILDASGKYAKGTNSAMVHNSIVVTDPAVTGSFTSVYGKPNLLPKSVATGKFLGVVSSTNSTVTISPEWDGFGGVGYKMVTTATSPATAIIGQNFFNDLGSKPMVEGKQYTIKVRLRKAATARTVKIGIQTYNNSGTALTPVTVDVLESTTADYDATVLVTAPTGAVKGNPVWQVVGAANGEVHGAARWGFYEGDARSQTWNASDNSTAESLVTPHALAGDIAYTSSLWQTDLLRNTLAQNSTERRIGFLGDSTGEGVGSSVWSNRVQTRFQDLARGRFGSASGKVQRALGYVPGTWAGITPAVTTLSGGSVLLDAQYGLGQRTVKIPTGGKVTYPSMVCDFIDVYYTANNFFPGTFTVTVDGTVVRTIDTRIPSGQIPKHVRIAMPGASGGSHVVVLTGTTSDTYFNGIEFRDNQSDGVYVVDSTHTGFKTDDYRGTSSQVAQQWAALRDANVTHLVVMLGANDMASYTPAQWGANIQDFISRAQSEITPGGWPVPVTFLHWGKLPTQPAAGGANPQDLALYEAAAVDACSRYINAEIVLLSRFWPDGSYTWSADGIHPNDTGADFIAQQILRRTWDQLTSNFIWFGSIWSSASKFFVTGMEIGSTPIIRENLARNPSMKGTVGNVYTSLNATGAFVSQASAVRGTALKVVATATSADSCVYVDGGPGAMRCGTVAGKTYTISALITSAGDSNAQNGNGVHCITAFYRSKTTDNWTTSRTPSVNGASSARVSTTFTLPASTTEVFFRLYNGGSQGTPDVTFADLLIEESATAGTFFDGTSRANSSDSLTTCWTSGLPDLSPSFALGSTAVVPQTTRVMQYDAATVALERVDNIACPDADKNKQWTTSAWVEGAYTYVFGKNSANQPVLLRVPVGDPFTASTAYVWTGSAWANGAATAQAINSDPYTFDSLRKVGSTYSAYYMIGFNPNIYRKTATSLTGPWTNDATPVYKTPESGGNVMTYIPRMYPQFDTAYGTAYGYSTNLIASNWGDPVSGPRFALGPQANLQATDISTQDYRAIQTVTESKAYQTGLENNTAIQVRVRTVDSSGLVSAPWTESAVAILTGTAGDTLTPPSKPSVSGSFQGLIVIWDGLDTNGNRPTDAWAAVQVHVSADGEFFQPTSLTQKALMPIYGPDGGPNVFPVQGLEPGKAYWVKLVTVGKPPNGGVSQPSAADTAVTATLVSSAITPGLITDAALGKGSVHAENLSVASYSEQLIPNANFEDGFENNLPKTWDTLNRYIGNGNVSPRQVTGAQAIGGTSSLALTVTPGNGRVIRSQIVALVPGDLYYFSAMMSTSRMLATDNSVSIALLYATDSNPDTFARYGIIAQSDLQLPLTAFKGATNGAVKVEGQLKVPADMTYGCLAIIAMPDDGATTNVDVVVDDAQLKRVVGTANIANAAINNAKIADASIDSLKVSEVRAGLITSDVLSATITLSGRILTASSGQRVELNTNGLSAYNASDLLPVTQVTTDGGLISKWLRTNTSGTRIEMGTYANGGNAANIAFFDGSATWQFPPVVGYGGGGAVNYPGVALHSGSRTETDYNNYGLSMIGLDQKGGIGIITGMKLDGTESTTGCDFTVDVGGSASGISLKTGGANWAQLNLLPTYGDSWLSLPGGALYFGIPSSGTNNSMKQSGMAWGNFISGHMIATVNCGIRWTLVDGTDLLSLTNVGTLRGNGPWSTPRILARSGTDYYSFNADGTMYLNQNTSKVAKTFVIDHPTDDDKYLVHATNEMPEARVDYTGNGKLEPAPVMMEPGGPNFKDSLYGANDVEITLPPYFTALADESTAVVLVSPYYHDCGPECEYNGTPSIAATKVKDGKFRVKAVGGRYHPCISFAYRVSAVRKDIAPLEVEPLKSSVVRRGDGPYTYIEN